VSAYLIGGCPVDCFVVVPGSVVVPSFAGCEPGDFDWSLSSLGSCSIVPLLLCKEPDEVGRILRLPNTAIKGRLGHDLRDHAPISHLIAELLRQRLGGLLFQVTAARRYSSAAASMSSLTDSRSIRPCLAVLRDSMRT
jgi:hypothetical protein